MEKEKFIALIQKAQSGDKGAMEEVLRTAHTSVSYQCRKLLRDPRNAEDVTQEVLLTVYTKLGSLKSPAAFWGWLNTTTANRCMDVLRRGNVEFPFAEDEGSYSLDDLEELDEQRVPDKSLDNAETTRMIEEIVNSLPEAQRICVLMYYYDEMSVKDIAAALGVPENTVKSRLNYARKAVKEKVLDYEKKGIKLYGLSPLPFMLYFLLRAAEETADSVAADIMAKKAMELGAAGAGAAAGGKAAVTAGVSAGGKTVGTALSAKFIAGSLATLLAVGGVTAVATATRNAEEPESTPPPAITEAIPVETEPEVTAAPESTGTPSMEEEPIPAERLALLSGITYYGDPAQCCMTVNQAAAYAEVLETSADAPYAALIDIGAGNPVLALARGIDGGAYIGSTPETSLPGHNRFDGKLEVWQYMDGRAELIAVGHEVYWMAGEGFVCQTRVGGTEDENGNPLPMEAQSHYLDFTADAYSVEGGALSQAPIASALVEIDLMGTYTSEGGTIDGQPVDQVVWPTWRRQWAEGGQTSIAIPQTWGFWEPYWEEDGWTTIDIGYDASTGGYVDKGTLDIQTVSQGVDTAAVLRRCAGE